MNSIVKWTMKQRKTSTIWWSVAVAVFIFINMIFYPTFKNDAEELQKSFENLSDSPHDGDLMSGQDSSGQVCPRCHRFRVDYLNVGRDHWFYCEPCGVRWLLGSHLFSSWWYETEADWERNRQTLSKFVEVD